MANRSNLVWEGFNFITWKNELSISVSPKGVLYATGGKSSSNSYGGDTNLYIYDTKSGLKSNGAPMNQGRRQHGSVFLGGYLYVIGGVWSSSEETVLDSIERYNPATDTWEDLPSLSSPRRCPGVCIYDNKIYLFGGWNGNSSLDTVEIYDPDSGQWQSGPNMPVAVKRGFAVTIGDRIWVALLMNSMDKYIYEYNPSTGVWRKFRFNFGDGEVFASAVAIGSHILIVSSFCDSKGFNWCWLFDAKSKTLSRTTDIPIGDNMAAAAADNNTFFVVGGYDTASQKAAYPPPEGAPEKLSFLKSPSNARRSQSFAQQPIIEVLDKNGNRVTGATGTVTISIQPGTGNPGAILEGTKQVPINAGLATSEDLNIDSVGTEYKFVAESAGLESATSEPFDIKDSETGGPIRLTNAHCPIDPEQPIVEHYPAAASDGNDFLAVWYRNWINESDITMVETFFSRVLSDGTVLAPSGTELKTGGYLASACWDGSKYWVVQNKYRNQDERILGVRINAEGDVLDGVPLKLGSAGYGSGASILPPSLAFNGERLLVVWEKVDPQGIYGSLFLPTGELLKESFLIASGINVEIPRVTALGSSFLVVCKSGLSARVSQDGQVLDVPHVDLAGDWVQSGPFACTSTDKKAVCVYAAEDGNSFKALDVDPSGCAGAPILRLLTVKSACLNSVAARNMLD
jgi:hypothetical protein